MVTKTTSYGLIVSPGPSWTAELDEVAAATSWPVLLGATVRSVSEELEWRRASTVSADAVEPRSCLLFWIQDRDEVVPTSRLVRWVRDREPDSCRIALAYCLEADVEPEIRSAGAHVYLPVSGSIRSVFSQVVWPLLERSTLGVTPSLALPIGGESYADEDAQASGGACRPP